MAAVETYAIGARLPAAARGRPRDRRAAPGSTCPPARRGSSPAPRRCACRARSATGWRGRRSCRGWSSRRAPAGRPALRRGRGGGRARSRPVGARRGAHQLRAGQRRGQPARAADRPGAARGLSHLHGGAAADQARCLSPALVRNLEEHWRPMSARFERAIWDPVEQLPRERLRELQLERLRATVDRVQPPGAPLRLLEDLRQLPFSWKSDLRDNYPFGLLAVPRERLVRARLERRPRQAHRGGLHARGPRRLGGADGALLTTAGAGRDGRPQRQRLRAVHRRPGLPRRRRADRRDRRPGLGRVLARQAMLLSDLGAVLAARRRMRW